MRGWRINWHVAALVGAVTGYLALVVVFLVALGADLGPLAVVLVILAGLLVLARLSGERRRISRRATRD